MREAGADKAGKCGKNTALPEGLRPPADSAIMSLRELFGKGEYGSGTGTAHLPVAEESAVKKNKETDGRRLGTEEKTALRARRAAGWMLTAALLILFLRTGAGRTAFEGLRDGLGGLLTLEWIAESGTGVKPEGEFTEEGIQIRLDEMRILFFRIRREEEKGQMPPEERQ